MEDVKRRGGYLKRNDEIIIYIHPCDSDIKVWADDDSSGNLFPEEAKYDSYTERSRSEFVVSYLVCPVMWKSKFQIEISLCSTESKYIVPGK